MGRGALRKFDLIGQKVVRSVLQAMNMSATAASANKNSVRVADSDLPSPLFSRVGARLFLGGRSGNSFGNAARNGGFYFCTSALRFVQRRTHMSGGAAGFDGQGGMGQESRSGGGFCVSPRLDCGVQAGSFGERISLGCLALIIPFTPVGLPCSRTAGMSSTTLRGSSRLPLRICPDTDVYCES